MIHLVGLLGYPLSHSFSKKYFTDFFRTHRLPYEYRNFEYQSVNDFMSYIPTLNHLVGFNITLPHKEAIMPFLAVLSDEAQAIGAVNCVKLLDNNRLKGYNTDAYGFDKLIEPVLRKMRKAVVLGNGGASKAVCYILEKRKIPFLVVARSPQNKHLSFDDLQVFDFSEYNTIINTTPVGQYPYDADTLPLPFEKLSTQNIVVDLIYNPAETVFLKKAKQQGAITLSGEAMLYEQAKKSWEIWSQND